MSQYYLLLENQQQGLKQLYSGKYSKPVVYNLFAGTELEGLKNQAPIVAIDQSVNLTTLQDTLQKNTGLIISTNYSSQDLLAHLRWLLMVYMSPEQTAIFRYYDPIISQYFFTSLSEQDTATWLGPIKRLEWFINTWRNKAYEDNKWQSWENPQANTWQKDQQKLQLRPRLEKRHSMALQDMQEEKFAYYWQQNPQKNTAKIDIDQAIYWVKQGINMGLWQDSDLERYLAIRSQHPTKRLPEYWTTNEATERLAYLAKYFNQTSVLTS